MIGQLDIGLQMPTEGEEFRELVEELNTRLAEQGLPPATATRDTLIGQTLALVAVRLGALGQALVQTQAERDPNNATGAQLDSILDAFSAPRRLAVSTQFESTLAGTPGTVLPAGRRIRIDNGSDDEYILAADTVLGTDTPVWVAAETGPNSVVLADTFTLLTPVSGWTGVGTLSNIAVGDDGETDAQVRQRILSGGYLGSSDAIPAVLRAVRTVPGVRTVALFNNDTTADQVVNGVTIPAHGFLLSIFPTLTADQEAQVAEAIALTAPAGIGTGGTESASYTTSDGVARTYNWEYAAQTLVDVSLQISIGPDAVSEDVAAEVSSEINTYIDDLGPGDALFYLRVLDVVAGVRDVLAVDSLAITVVGGPGAAVPSPGRRAEVTEIFDCNEVTVTTVII